MIIKSYMAQYQALTGLTNVNVSTLNVKQNANFKSDVTLSALNPNGVLSLDGSDKITSNLLPDGYVLIGRTGNQPVAAPLTGTTNQVNITNGPGSITLGLPQSIATTSDVTFHNLTLSGAFNPTAFDNSLLPQTYNTYDIGSPLFAWRNAYYAGTVNAFNACLSGLTASTLIATDSKQTLQSVVLANNSANGNNSTIGFSGNTLTLNASNSQDISTAGSPSFANVTDTGLTASSIVSNNASKQLVSAGITNSNGCNMSVNSAGNITNSMTQNLDTTGSPSFAGETLTGNLTMGLNDIASVRNVTASGTVQGATFNFTGLTASKLTATDASKNLQSVSITNNSANGNNTTLSFATNTLTVNASNSQDISTAGSPSFANVTDTGLTASSIVSNNASKQLVSAGITNRNGCALSVNSAGNITASMNQNLDTSGNPSFSGITTTGTSSALCTGTGSCTISLGDNCNSIANRAEVDIGTSGTGNALLKIGNSSNVVGGQIQLVSSGGSSIISTNATSINQAIAIPNNGGINASFIIDQTAQNINGIKTFADTTNATSTTSAGCLFSGGIGVSKTIYSKDLVVTDTTDATSTTTGSAIVSGGLGVAKTIYSKDVNLTDTTDSTSTTTGTLICAGGAGIAKTIYCGSGINLGNDTLSVYKKGTWTPGLSSNGNTTGIAYSQQGGNYRRIGDMVFVDFFVETSSKLTSVGNILLTGLPYNYNGGQPGTAWGSAWASIAGTFVIAGIGSTKTANVNIGSPTGSYANVTQGNMNSTIILAGQFYYYTNDAA